MRRSGVQFLYPAPAVSRRPAMPSPAGRSRCKHLASVGRSALFCSVVQWLYAYRWRQRPAAGVDAGANAAAAADPAALCPATSWTALKPSVKSQEQAPQGRRGSLARQQKKLEESQDQVERAKIELDGRQERASTRRKQKHDQAWAEIEQILQERQAGRRARSLELGEPGQKENGQQGRKCCPEIPNRGGDQPCYRPPSGGTLVENWRRSGASVAGKKKGS